MKAFILGLLLLAPAVHAQELFPIQQVSNGPTVSVDNLTPAAGSIINVTVNGGPGNPFDFIQLVLDPNKNYIGPFVYLNGATSGTFQLPIPVTAQDRPAGYAVAFNSNNSFNTLAQSAHITVPATLSPPAPTATLPTALAADPFTPAHTFTVCASGCNYTNPADAITAAAGLDNVLIKVSSGEYQGNLPVFAIPHLWIRGSGSTMPHLFGTTSTSASIIGTTQATCSGSTPTATFTMDNLELGPWNYWTVKSTDCITFTMRNSYIHDSPQGMITGNTQHLTLNLYNDVFARHGSGDGPEHDIYVGEGDDTNIVNVVNSVFEAPIVGHAFKSRAKTMNANCSMFIVNYDTVYLGSETIDPSDGGAYTWTNILSASGGADQAWAANSAWDQNRYGNEGDIAGYTNAPVATGSVFLTDETSGFHDMLGLRTRITSPPVTWSNNKFIFPSAAVAHSDGSQNSVVECDTAHNCLGTDVTIDGTNTIYASRSAASLPAVTYPLGWRDFLPLMPAACTDPIGNVAVPPT